MKLLTLSVSVFVMFQRAFHRAINAIDNFLQKRLTPMSCLLLHFYYHLRPSLKHEGFCAKFYFSNVNGLSGYSVVSLLTNETLAVMS